MLKYDFNNNNAIVDQPSIWKISRDQIQITHAGGTDNMSIPSDGQLTVQVGNIDSIISTSSSNSSYIDNTGNNTGNEGGSSSGNNSGSDSGNEGGNSGSGSSPISINSSDADILAEAAKYTIAYSNQLAWSSGPYVNVTLKNNTNHDMLSSGSFKITVNGANYHLHYRNPIPGSLVEQAANSLPNFRLWNTNSANGEFYPNNHHYYGATADQPTNYLIRKNGGQMVFKCIIKDGEGNLIDGNNRQAPSITSQTLTDWTAYTNIFTVGSGDLLLHNRDVFHKNFTSVSVQDSSNITITVINNSNGYLLGTNIAESDSMYDVHIHENGTKSFIVRNLFYHKNSSTSSGSSSNSSGTYKSGVANITIVNNSSYTFDNNHTVPVNGTTTGLQLSALAKVYVNNGSLSINLSVRENSDSSDLTLDSNNNPPCRSMASGFVLSPQQSKTIQNVHWEVNSNDSNDYVPSSGLPIFSTKHTFYVGNGYYSTSGSNGLGIVTVSVSGENGYFKNGGNYTITIN